MLPVTRRRGQTASGTRRESAPRAPRHASAETSKDREVELARHAYELRTGRTVEQDGFWALAFAAYPAGDEWLWHQRRAHLNRLRRGQPTPPWPPLPEWIVRGLSVLEAMVDAGLSEHADEARRGGHWEGAIAITADACFPLWESRKPKPFDAIRARLAIGERVRRHLQKVEPLPELPELAAELRAALGGGDSLPDDLSLIMSSIDFYAKVRTIQRPDAGRPQNFGADWFATFLCVHRQRCGLPPPTLLDAGDLWLILVGEGVRTREQAKNMMRNHLLRAARRIKDRQV